MVGAALEGSLRAGDRIGGKFVVERRLGEGGMAIVYAARHEMLAQLVAVKVIRGGAGSADHLRRFIHEARAVAQLRSHHVARVMDVGVGDDGLPYIAMELLEGMDLGQLVARRGPLPVHVAVDYVLQALEAVAEAHAAGLVHRDLKPANLFLIEGGAAGTIKVLDFGISKVTGGAFTASASASTSTGAILGTPAYMSPEQLRNAKTVDARADLWSLGVILHELLAGRQPFAGETVGEVFAAILEKAPARLLDCRPDVPPALAAVVDRCMKKERDDRFSGVAEMARALAPFGSQAAGASVAEVERLAARIPTMTDVAPLTSPTGPPSALGAAATAENVPSAFVTGPTVISTDTGAVHPSLSSIQQTAPNWSASRAPSVGSQPRTRTVLLAAGALVVSCAIGAVYAGLRSSRVAPASTLEVPPTGAAPAVATDSPAALSTPPVVTFAGAVLPGPAPPPTSTVASSIADAAAPAVASPKAAKAGPQRPPQPPKPAHSDISNSREW